MRPEFEGTGEIILESVDRANGYWTTRSHGSDNLQAKTSGVYLRADPGDKEVLDNADPSVRINLIKRRLDEWKAGANF